MENYVRTRTVERCSICPFTDLPTDTPQIRVKDGSKIRNLLRFALSHMDTPPLEEDREGGGASEGVGETPRHPPCRHLVFTASGKGVSKAVTCAEMVKRRLKGLHQVTRLDYSTMEEVWEPKEHRGVLDGLTVSRNLPAIWILLSTEMPDQNQLGYQAPGHYGGLWEDGGGRGGGQRGQRRRGGDRRGGDRGVRGKGGGGLARWARESRGDRGQT
ncbi:ribonuclease P protein subunit p25-like protein [Pholidichthys leucotaenia]